MRFVSTAGEAPPVSLADALRCGAAPDGGLYMPDGRPALEGDRLDPQAPLATFASTFLGPFFAGDRLAEPLPNICRGAFDFDVPLVVPDPAAPGLRALELFHGPTGAFKDFGARFLMGCFERLAGPLDPLTVLVATSGDTGGAVGCAAEGRAAVRAAILYPRQRVSPFQELQLTCWGRPVEALEVDGDFDDCQRLVKAAFADAPLRSAHRLTSANSINLGRLLPQVAYAAQAALGLFRETGRKPGFLVPTGNLGHGFAVLYARALGLPIGPVILATNANRTLADWHADGVYAPRPAVATFANAMDVGAPSNFERLRSLAPAARDVRVVAVADAAIAARIREEFARTGYVWCPHSATAAEAYRRLSPDEQAARPWIAAATAHPYKFRQVVEPLIGAEIAPAPALAAILGRASRKRSIAASLDALAGALEERCRRPL
jgi:threonine synthase